MDKKPEAEIDILYPDRVLTLAGEQITVRELAFAQTLRLEAAMAPLIQAFVELPTEEAGESAAGQFAELFGAHAHAWIGFMALACGKPREWVEQLSDADGTTLSMTVWGVNSAFFTRRVLTQMVTRHAATTAVSGTANCTPH